MVETVKPLHRGSGDRPENDLACQWPISMIRLIVFPEAPVFGVEEMLGCVVVPAAVVTLADVTIALPGHHARKTPLPVVVTMSEPSLSSNVAAVTPGPTEPSAIVYAWPSLADSASSRSTTIWPALGDAAWAPPINLICELAWALELIDGPLTHKRVVDVVAPNKTRVKGPRVSTSDTWVAPVANPAVLSGGGVAAAASHVASALDT
jgi:hypothetical protein